MSDTAADNFICDAVQNNETFTSIKKNLISIIKEVMAGWICS